MKELDEKIQELRAKIASLEWDIPHMLNKDIKSNKMSRLESYKNELSKILNTGG